MKDKLMLFFKGMILGLAMIIPGVSGGTLAISMGIYERIIKTISHFFSDFKENFKFLFFLGLGAVVSLAISALLLDYTFEHYPLPTTIFFIGLLIGSIPMLFEKVEFKKTINIKNIILIVLGAGVLLGVSFLKSGGNVVFGSFTGIQTFKLIVVGFIAAATLVIPGISGSFMLMVLGYYEPILAVISDTIKLNNIGSNLLILVPFGVGVILGVLVLVKLIEYLMNKYEIKTYYVIIGFLIASVVDVFVRSLSYTVSLLQIIISIVLFVLGGFLSLKVFKG